MRLHFQEERTDLLIASLRNTLILGGVFTLLQLAGWYELDRMGIEFQRNSKREFSLFAFWNPYLSLAWGDDFRGDFIESDAKAKGR